jgi:hypothetical protein
MFEWYLEADPCELLAVAVMITGLLALLFVLRGVPQSPSPEAAPSRHSYPWQS